MKRSATSGWRKVRVAAPGRLTIFLIVIRMAGSPVSEREPAGLPALALAFRYGAALRFAEGKWRGFPDGRLRRRGARGGLFVRRRNAASAPTARPTRSSAISVS